MAGLVNLRRGLSFRQHLRLLAESYAPTAVDA